MAAGQRFEDRLLTGNRLSSLTLSSCSESMAGIVIWDMRMPARYFDIRSWKLGGGSNTPGPPLGPALFEHSPPMKHRFALLVVAAVFLAILLSSKTSFALTGCLNNARGPIFFSAPPAQNRSALLPFVRVGTVLEVEIDSVGPNNEAHAHILKKHTRISSKLCPMGCPRA